MSNFINTLLALLMLNFPQDFLIKKIDLGLKPRKGESFSLEKIVNWSNKPDTLLINISYLSFDLVRNHSFTVQVYINNRNKWFYDFAHSWPRAIEFNEKSFSINYFNSSDNASFTHTIFWSEKDKAYKIKY